MPVTTDETPTLPSPLSDLEECILVLLFDGKSVGDIGIRLGLSSATVGAYLTTIRRKLGAPAHDQRFWIYAARRLHLARCARCR